MESDRPGAGRNRTVMLVHFGLALLLFVIYEMARAAGVVGPLADTAIWIAIAGVALFGLIRGYKER